MRHLVDRCATEGEPFDEEMQIVTLKGRRAWVRAIGNAVRSGGTVVRIECAVQEIAPQGHREGTLMWHAVSMGGAMGGGEAFATVDRNGRFTYLNQEAERLLGRAGRERVMEHFTERHFGERLWGALALERSPPRDLEKSPTRDLERPPRATSTLE